MPTFDVNAALQSGVSEDEIFQYLSGVNPKFNTNAALSAGKSKREIIDYLSTHSEPKLPSPGEQRESTARNIWNTVSPIVSEGGPAAVGAIGGGILGGPPGAVIGGALGEGSRQAFRRVFGPDEFSPQSLPAAYTEQAIAGFGGLLSPEAAAARYPLAAQAGKYGSQLPPKMKLSEARRIEENLPIARPQVEAEFSAQRAATAQQMREARALAQEEFNKKVTEGLEPLRQEKNRIMNKRGQKSAELARQRTHVTENLREDLRGLKESTELEKSAVQTKANEEASLFVKSVGREMTKTEIAEGSLQARVRGQQAYTARVRSLYKELEEKIFPLNPKEVTTGKMVETGAVDASGKPIMKPETKLISGGIDRSALQDKLRPLADRYREELTSARQNGSPGASAILQIVDGESVVSGRAALDDLAALNKFGYSKADAGLKTQAEAVTRKVADEYRKTIHEEIGKMKDGARATELLDEARALLAERDRIFRTGVGVESNRPIAQRAMRSVEDSGNVASLVNDPIKLRTVLAQVDDETFQGIRNRIAELSLGKNQKDFAKNWRNLDKEVKSQIFTPQQIADADAIATRGAAALEEIAQRELKANTQLIKDATAKIRQIGDERMRLAQNPVAVRDLETKIRLAKNAAEKEKMQKSLEIMRKAADQRKAIAEQQTMYRQGYEIQIRQARQRIKEVEDARKRLAIGAGVVGLGAASNWTFNKIAPLLGWGTP